MHTVKKNRQQLSQAPPFGKSYDSSTRGSVLTPEQNRPIDLNTTTNSLRVTKPYVSVKNSVKGTPSTRSKDIENVCMIDIVKTNTSRNR